MKSLLLIGIALVVLGSQETQEVSKAKRPEPTTNCPVLIVVDGSSVVVRNDEGSIRVWLLGVEQPETKHDGACEALRVAHLKTLLEAQSVRLQVEPGREQDPKKRPVAHLYRVTDGLWVNEEMIRRGFGTASPYRFQDSEQFRAIEKEARVSKIGVWSPEALSAAAEDYDRKATERRGRQEQEIARRRAERNARREAINQQVEAARRRAREEARRESKEERCCGCGCHGKKSACHCKECACQT